MWIVSLAVLEERQLSEAHLPLRAELGSLPDVLETAISRAAPNALELDSVFLLTDAQKKQLESHLERLSLPYHEYAVETRGERCIEGCPEHRNLCVVYHLNDHIRRNQRAGRTTPQE